MRIPLLLVFSGLVISMLVFSASGQSHCDYKHLPPQFSNIVDSARERVTKGELPSIAISVAHHGSIVCEQAFGLANREKQLPPGPNTVYAAGSVAKAVTGAAVFMLVSQGKLGLDDTPEQYGVRVRTYQTSKITVRQLLSMTAGIQHGWYYDYATNLDARELLQQYAISAFPPGEHFIYSNFSYGILGEIVEQAGKRRFSEFVRDQLLNPLQMTSSGFNLEGRNVAAGYQAGRAVPHHTFDPEAGGGFYTSARDLALFGLFQLDPIQKLIPPERMKEMHTLETSQQIKSRYANGWGILNFKDGSSVLLSDGRVLAGSATLLVIPKPGVVIACLTNTSSEVTDELAFQIGDAFSNGLLSNLESARKEIEAAEELQPFHANEQQRGFWLGSVDTPKGKLPVRMQIASHDHIQIGIANGAMIPVEHSGIDQGLLSGEAAIRIGLPQTANQPSKLQLELLWIDGNQLIGTARAESVGDLPAFGLPLYMSLYKQ